VLARHRPGPDGFGAVVDVVTVRVTVAVVAALVGVVAAPLVEELLELPQADATPTSRTRDRATAARLMA
jgi:hypothetical protein